MVKKYLKQSFKPKNYSIWVKSCIFALCMSITFPIEINILDFIFKGIIIGIIASAPMGPVGILCIQRTLNKGRWYGFVTGIGAACSDIVYALFTGLGMSFVMDFVNNAQNKFYLQIFGGLLLLAFGIYCFKSNPTKNMHQSSNKQGSLTHNAITAFFVNNVTSIDNATIAATAFSITGKKVSLTNGVKADITVCSIDGRTLQQAYASEIDLDAMGAGIYVVTATTGDGRVASVKVMM